MSSVTSGYNPFMGLTGSSYWYELVRAGARVLSEITSDPVASTVEPRTGSVLRREQTVAGNSARGIAATWAPVAGLEDIPLLVVYPGQWNENQADPNALRLHDTERMIWLMDVPEGGNVAANRLVTTDRVAFSDDQYGDTSFEVMQVDVQSGAGWVRARVRYAREE